MEAVERFVSREKLEDLARRCNLVKRRRVISGPALIQAALGLCGKARVSLESWACAISVAAGVSISKQAVHQRFAAPAVEFFRAVVGAILLARAETDAVLCAGSWKRILVQDSTIFPPPQRAGGRLPRQRKPLGQSLGLSARADRAGSGDRDALSPQC